MKKISWKLGSIDWFDKVSGKGYISSKDGTRYFFHESALKDSTLKKNSLKKNKKIKFKANDDPFVSQIKKVKEA